MIRLQIVSQFSDSHDSKALLKKLEISGTWYQFQDLFISFFTSFQRCKVVSGIPEERRVPGKVTITRPVMKTQKVPARISGEFTGDTCEALASQHFFFAEDSKNQMLTFPMR